jgi:hypothetical protein
MPAIFFLVFLLCGLIAWITGSHSQVLACIGFGCLAFSIVQTWEKERDERHAEILRAIKDRG